MVGKGMPGDCDDHVTVAFRVYCHTHMGDRVVVVGNVPALGDWEPTRGVELHTTAETYPLWRGEVGSTCASPPPRDALLPHPRRASHSQRPERTPHA